MCRKLWNILRNCRFYDPISGLYSTRPMQRADSVEAGPGVSAEVRFWPQGSTRAHRIMPRAAGYVHTAIFINTRGLGSFPDDLCPLGARRVELAGVPRVAAVVRVGQRRTDRPCAARVGNRQHHDVDRCGCGTGQRRVGDMLRRSRARRLTGFACDDDRIRARHSRSTATLSEHSHHRRPFARIDRCSLSGREGRRERTCAICFCSLRHARCRMYSNAGPRNEACPEAWSRQIYRELERRDGVPVSHWDIRTLGLPTSVRVRILHDPTDEVVPVSDFIPDRSGYLRGCP